MGFIRIGRDRRILNEPGGSGINVCLQLAVLGDQLRVPGNPTDTVTGHCRPFGEGVEDEYPLRRNFQCGMGRLPKVDL